MGALEAPQDRHGQEHRTGTSRAEQTKEAMAKLGAPKAMAGAGSSGGHGGAGSSGGHGGAGSSGGHGRCRELRRPWWCRELRRPWQVQGAQEAMAGARSSGGHGRCKELRRPWWCRELRRPWQVVFVAVASSLGPATPAGTLLPPKKISMGQLGGIRSPPGLDKQDST